jgi:hypothetical protein
MKHIKKMRFGIIVFGLLCIVLLFGTDTSATDKNACSEDVAKFCPNISPGIFALMDCLEKNESRLTPACKEYEATLLGGKVERREKVNNKIKFRQACQSDMAKFCNDADPMQGGMVKCLDDHKHDISDACSKSLKEIMY